MLRFIFFALIVLNLGYFVWARGDIDAAGEREPQRLDRQVRPQLLQIRKSGAPQAQATPSPAPAPAPAQPAALPTADANAASGAPEAAPAPSPAQPAASPTGNANTAR
jgi:hypothetical protein